MQYEHLTQRGVIALSGADAVAFLQGLISGNAERLNKGEAVYAALLSPQGKFLHDLFLVSHDGKILIDCERARMDDLRKRFMLYKLRSNVTVEATDLNVVAVWDSPSPVGGGSGWGHSGTEADNPRKDAPLPTSPLWGEEYFSDPRLPQLGWRIVGDAKKIQSALSAAPGDYDAMRLTLGVPDGSRDLIVDKSILLEWGFEDLHGVDFLKGCYVGQEVTARSKYRGQLKKYIHQVKSDGALPPAGTAITAGGQAIGEMRSSHDGMGLAIVRVAELAKAQQEHAPLKAGDADITLALPQWFTPPSQ